MSDVGAALLEFLDVSKWYGQVSALTDVTLRIEAGVTGMVGKNGAGKSTLMKLACGLLRPSQGAVLVDGRAPADDPAARARLGVCPDIDQYYERLAGWRFVSWMLRYHGVGTRAADARAKELLAELGLGDAMYRTIAGYSKGMRQRVKLAQALAHDPRIVLLDEPLTGLDPVARHEVGELIRRLAAGGRAVIVSSHVLHELQAVADTVVLIHQGRLIAEGRVQDLRQQLEGRPLKLRLKSREPRALASRLAPLDGVVAIHLQADGVLIETAGAHGLHERLTRLGAEPEGLIDEIAPMDDTLEAVFGYLVA